MITISGKFYGHANSLAPSTNHVYTTQQLGVGLTISVSISNPTSTLFLKVYLLVTSLSLHNIIKLHETF